VRLAPQVEHRDLADRRTPVVELPCRLEQVRLAGAVAEPAMVEHERRGLIGHGEVQPCRAGFPRRVEEKVESLHAQRTSPDART
jgi:hypothetical protein